MEDIYDEPHVAHTHNRNFLKSITFKSFFTQHRYWLLQSEVSIFGFSFLIRFLYNITVAKGYYPLHDAFEYQNIALNLIHNHCYCLLPNTHISTVKRAPLWPLVIMLIYKLVGEHNLFVRLFLCVIGSGTCAITYRFARDLFGRHVGLFAGVLAALYPFLFVYDGWLYSESLYTFLLLAFCYTLYLLQHNNHRPKIVILSGILLGLVILTRPNGLLILFIYIVWLLLAVWSKIFSLRAAAKNGVLIVFMALALVLPWTLRNGIVSHAFVPIAVGDGTVLIGAYNDKIVGTWYENGYYEGTWLAPEEVLSMPKQATIACDSACEVAEDTIYKNDAIRWINGHIETMPIILAQHLLNLWLSTSKEADLALNRYPDKHASQIVVIMMQIMTPIILLVAMCGIVLTWRRWRTFLFIDLIIASTILQSVVFYGIPRFRAPIEPYLILLASSVLWYCFTKSAKKAQ